MRIAVLMSSYNGENYIREQIESVLAQKGDFSLDIWVRDDGSTDGTVDILEDYARQGKLQWYSGENLGAARSFLNLVQHCTEYDCYAFADQDDYWYPDKLARGIRGIAGETAMALYVSNAHLVDRALASLGRNVNRNVLHCDFYTLACAGSTMGCTFVFNEALAKVLRQYPNPKSLIMHDSYIALVCAFLDGKVVYDHAPSLDYRQHGNNVVGMQWTKLGALRDRIRRVTKPSKGCIADQAKSVLDGFAAQAKDEEKIAFLRDVADYRKSFFSATKLACCGKPKYSSRNMAFTIRLAIALRNH